MENLTQANRFAGKRILLTGAASGIGRATAQRLAAEGGRVFGVDRDAEGLKSLAGDAITVHVADVADERQVAETVKAAIDQMDGLDVLVTAAGIHRVTPLPELTPADFLDLFRVNLLGTFLVCREAMPYLADISGVVVTISSTAALHGHPFMLSYAASKGAVHAFSRSLAAEVAPRGVRVVTVLPGGVQTPLVTNMRIPDGLDPSFYARTRPLMDYGQPEQIAATIAYAASADGGYLIGDVRVDGGSHI
jgi:NAD(P)-dependent dehydrogenase (short-subunit alcohol dehydrogenase family)